MCKPLNNKCRGVDMQFNEMSAVKENTVQFLLKIVFVLLFISYVISWVKNSEFSKVPTFLSLMKIELLQEFYIPLH